MLEELCILEILDLILTTEDSEGQLRWFARDIESGQLNDLGLFGWSGSQINMGSWLPESESSRVYVRRDRWGQYELFVDTASESVVIGRSTGSSSVILGRDINGNGLSDATFVQQVGRRWAWRFSFDPFTQSPSKRRVFFGTTNAIPFMFYTRGASISIGILRTRGGRASIEYRNLKRKRKRRIRLKGFLVPNVRPIPMKHSGTVRETLAFRSRTESGTSIITIDRRGNKENSIIVPDGFYPIVGDLNGDGTQDIGLVGADRILVSGNREIKLSRSFLVPLDAHSVTDYSKNSPEIPVPPSPTIFITSTPTEVPTVTPSKTPTLVPSPTWSPTPSSSVTKTPTVLPSPSQTPTASPSATPTPTPTIVPSLTPTQTFTPTSTVTPTPTYTATATITPTPDLSVPLLSAVATDHIPQDGIVLSSPSTVTEITLKFTETVNPFIGVIKLCQGTAPTCDAVVRSYDVEATQGSQSGQFQLSGQTLSLHFSAGDLTKPNRYFVDIPSGAFRDTGGNINPQIDSYDLLSFQGLLDVYSNAQAA